MISRPSAARWWACWPRPDGGSEAEQHRRAVAEEALVRGDAGPGALDLAGAGAALQLPRDLAPLGDRLRGPRLAEAGEPAARVDGDALAPDGGVAVVDEPLGLAGLAEPEVLVPVELERGREVVDLGDVDVVGAEPGLLVGAPRDRVAERALGGRDDGGGVGGERGQVDDRVGEGRRDRGDGSDAHGLARHAL